MNSSGQSVRRTLMKLEQTQPTSQLYRQTVMNRLREAVPFAAACCTMVDPNTLLSTGAIAEDRVEAIHGRLFEYEYLHDDFNKYERLAVSREPVATLSGATGGRLERSGRYREVLRPAGFGDELRAALLCDGACWGYLTLFRGASQPMFSEADCGFIASIAPLMARALRRAGLTLPKRRPGGEDSGILVLTKELERLSGNAAADRWMEKLRAMELVCGDTLPRPVRAVCSRALAGAEITAARVCIHVPDSGYTSLRAMRLNGGNGAVQLAVSFEAARPSEFVPLVTEAYALTERERQIAALVFRGLSTGELAAELHISAYTVQDHLKSIFAKTGVASRRELTWLLLSAQDPNCTF